MKYSFTQFPSSRTTVKSESLKKKNNTKIKFSFNSTSDLNLSHSVSKPFSNTTSNFKLNLNLNQNSYKINCSGFLSKKALSSTMASSSLSKRTVNLDNCEKSSACILKQRKFEENTIKQDINFLMKELKIKTPIKEKEMRESLSNSKEWIQCTNSFRLQNLYRQHNNILSEYVNKNHTNLKKYQIANTNTLDELFDTNSFKIRVKNIKDSEINLSEEKYQFLPLPNKLIFGQNSIHCNIEKKLILSTERRVVASRRQEYISKTNKSRKKVNKFIKDILDDEPVRIKNFTETRLSYYEKMNVYIIRIQRVWRKYYYCNVALKIIYIQKVIRGFFSRNKIISINFIKELKSKLEYLDYIISKYLLRQSFYIILSSIEINNDVMTKCYNDINYFLSNHKWKSNSLTENHLIAKSCLENILINVENKMNNNEEETYQISKEDC